MNIIDILKNDGVGVLATDTVYGVVGVLSSPIAVERIYKVKKRSPHKPVGTILIASVEQLDGMVEKDLVNIAAKYWPGPTSVVLPVGAEMEYAHKGLSGLPFRIPDDEHLVSILRQTGPLATSSANLESNAPAMNIGQAKQYFGHTVDFYEDSGDLFDRLPSKIIKILKDGNIQKIRS